MNTAGKKVLFKDWGMTILEILKWSFVIWLLLPLSRVSQEVRPNQFRGLEEFTRVLLGILLFIIFSGKVFYDTVIMGFIQQRRTTLKQDAVMFLGVILFICFIVGLMGLWVSLYLVQVGDLYSEFLR